MSELDERCFDDEVDAGRIKLGRLKKSGALGTGVLGDTNPPGFRCLCERCRADIAAGEGIAITRWLTFSNGARWPAKQYICASCLVPSGLT